MMKKTLLIVNREYLSRVLTKPYWVLCLVLPVLLTAMLMSTMINTGSSEKSVHQGNETVLAVIDSQGILQQMPPKIGNIVFERTTSGLENAKKNLENKRIDAILSITGEPTRPEISLFSYGEPPEGFIRAVELSLKDELASKDALTIASGTNDFSLAVKDLKPVDESGAKVELGAVLGIGMACIIYFFIFFYGVRTLNAVVEEKTNRISEIIISSVRPFELMLGKILGTTLAVFTQVVIVVGITYILSSLGAELIAPDAVDQQNLTPEGGTGFNVISALSEYPWFKMTFGFMAFFVFGFMLYSAIFAAIGAAMEPNDDTLQFVFPVLIPLVFSVILVITSALSDPNNNVVIWTSFIPFTSPVVMPMRMAYGVPWWQLITSIIILIGSFVGLTFLAGRIYRVGILLYGTKPSLRMIGKWLFTTE